MDTFDPAAEDCEMPSPALALIALLTAAETTAAEDPSAEGEAAFTLTDTPEGRQALARDRPENDPPQQAGPVADQEDDGT
ncbi:hypothetical protein GCM10018793_64210 [Streptomyces sulfonofaciens]|uniref:Uncharacterized protein n=1 Tax=Streptomyces sulfonofaciens TaxID=68272 RepID=A0A919L7E5_9ACTN|nr:hypothetical protein [Streptomyces sulfonofaciens]GHH87640.1 hypothetical protein GCM10018793_64210 [Streptomyces sulfonofaciens]